MLEYRVHILLTNTKSKIKYLSESGHGLKEIFPRLMRRGSLTFFCPVTDKSSEENEGDWTDNAGREEDRES